MSASAQISAVSATDASTDISARIAQLSTHIMTLQKQAQDHALHSAAAATQDETEQRRQIQAHYQEIFHLEREHAQLCNRRPNHLGVVLAVAVAAAACAH